VGSYIQVGGSCGIPHPVQLDEGCRIWYRGSCRGHCTT
jgi:hypothetical protein